MESSPSVSAIANLRCPSPAPIINNTPTSAHNHAHFSTQAPPNSLMINHDDGKHHVLLAATGATAVGKIKMIASRLLQTYGSSRIVIHVILTKAAARMLPPNLDFPPEVHIWQDNDEWLLWTNRNDPVLHIELRRWAHVLVIAPLTANTLAKISLGICDNLLTNVVRAWNTQYPILLAPAMVSFAYNNPITKKHLKNIKEEMKWIEVLRPTEKIMGSFGDIGLGGMMDWNEIVVKVIEALGGLDDDEDEEEEEADENEEAIEEDDDDDDDDDEDDEEEEEEEEEKEEQKMLEKEVEVEENKSINHV